MNLWRTQACRCLPVALCVVVICWLSLSEAPPRVKSGLLSWDKAAHALSYAGLTVIAGVAFGPLFSDRIKGWWAAFLFSVVLGGTMEILQGAVTRNRSADWGDLLADAVGSLAVLMIVFSIRLVQGRDQSP